jgi:hypothetical protein
MESRKSADVALDNAVDNDSIRLVLGSFTKSRTVV